jgi:small subunit ribosomal protein S23
MSTAEAYDIARKEFYEVRYNEDVERKVAREEALAVGASFGKSYMEVGMELEDKEWENFKAWAMITTHATEARRLAQYRGLEGEDSDTKPETATADDPEGAEA